MKSSKFWSAKEGRAGGDYIERKENGRKWCGRNGRDVEVRVRGGQERLVLTWCGNEESVEEKPAPNSQSHEPTCLCRTRATTPPYVSSHVGPSF
ncbi:hypothetical protein VNO78_26370 [Psophocarpus tetragonolobus]|uniref:Uncharacterized protein n=1 Tax=Psophocarpus tetragonolobus TaxID=3891 RepID=A0AAN9X8F8_PSOTE